MKITKDIADVSHLNTRREPEDLVQQEKQESHTGTVDDIFNAADEEMRRQSSSSQIRRKKKKKKRHPIRNSILLFIITPILLLAAIGVFAVHEVKQQLPTIKQSILQQWEQMQTDILNTDDNSLTLEEYYQKQILLLISVEELDRSINSITDLKKLQDILSDGELAIDSFIPQEKIDEFNRLKEEYQKAKEEQEQTTSVEYDSTGPNYSAEPN